jgi:hypothetical protein
VTEPMTWERLSPGVFRVRCKLRSRRDEDSFCDFETTVYGLGEVGPAVLDHIGRAHP